MVSVEIVYTRGLRLCSYVLKVKPKRSISVYGTSTTTYIRLTDMAELYMEYLSLILPYLPNFPRQ